MKRSEFLTNAEILQEIMSARGLSSNLFGQIEALKEILVHQTIEDAEDIMLDTFMMLENEIKTAYEQLGLDGEIA